MTGNDLFREVGNISEKYITEAEETKRSIIHNVVFRRSLATAACLMVCVGLYFGVRTGSKEAASYSDAIPQSDASGSGMNAAVASEESDEEVHIKDILEDAFGSNNKTDNAVQEGAVSDYYSEEAENSMSREPEEDIGASIDNWEDPVDRLSAYPNDYESLLQTDAFVVAHGTVKSGMEKWNAFVDSVNKGEPAWVDVVQFTEEGDAIITAVVFMGDWYYVLADHTRDVWGKQEMTEYEYSYLYFDIQDGRNRVVLTDLKLDEEEISNVIDKEPTQFFVLVQYGNE